MTHSRFLAPKPYYILPVPRLIALVQERTTLERGLGDAASTAERDRREHRIREIDQVVATDGRAREEQERQAIRSATHHSCGCATRSATNEGPPVLVVGVTGKMGGRSET